MRIGSMELRACPLRMDGLTTRQVDGMLLPLLQVTGEAESQQLLSQLISAHADPIIKDIIKSKLLTPNRTGASQDMQDAEDLHGRVIVQILERLRDFRLSPDESAINDFRGYVAVVTFHACNRYFRRKYPQRDRLKNKLRYILSHHQSFALWEQSNRDWHCGFSAWKDAGNHASRAVNLQKLRDDHDALNRTGLSGQDIHRLELGDLSAAIFRWAGRPVELDDLVNTVGDLLGIRDQTSQPQSFEETRNELEEQLADPRVDIGAEFDQRSCFERLWAEICQLPHRQRIALLLNLRDEQDRGVIGLLPLTGIRTFHQIAEALSMTDEQFAELWNQLPLDDAAIAGHLGISRQQVINLRKSARQRLVRRMKDFR
jgi:hypothetical protein